MKTVGKVGRELNKEINYTLQQMEKFVRDLSFYRENITHEQISLVARYLLGDRQYPNMDAILGEKNS